MLQSSRPTVGSAAEGRALAAAAGMVLVPLLVRRMTVGPFGSFRLDVAHRRL